MKVSVIIPARASQDFLDNCIESIAKQTLKPHEILVGCDNCDLTLARANIIQRRYARKKALASRLLIRVFEFPQRVYPYIARNTLAAMSTGEVLSFFDADDIMYPQHLEWMASAVNQKTFVCANAELTEDGADPIPWPRAHGVLCILKTAFFAHNGFEPWICAADSEARLRWIRGGMIAKMPVQPSMLVRKHAGGLTRAEDTKYGSPIRQGYTEEIARRSFAEYRSKGMVFGQCVEWIGGESGEYPNKIPVMLDRFEPTGDKPKKAKPEQQAKKPNDSEPVVIYENTTQGPVKVPDKSRCPHCNAKVSIAVERPFMCGNCYQPVV